MENNSSVGEYGKPGLHGCDYNENMHGIKTFSKEEIMFEQENIFTQGLVQIIRNLKKSGIEDITTEVVSLHNGNKRMRFRFYTEDQWVANPENKANEAVSLFGKTYKGKYKMPNHLVSYEQVQYFVVEVK